MPRCLDETQRLAAADPMRPLPATWGEHLAVCARCRDEVAAVRGLGAALGELGGAERRASSDPARTWAAVAVRLERPTLTQRLPLAWAGVARVACDLARPALAGSLVALLVGLGLGTWLGIAAGRTSAAAEATDAFATSNLDAAADDGFESGFLNLDATSGADDGAPTADDTLGDGARP